MGDVASSDGHYAGARVLALGHVDGHETSANLGHEADGTAAGDAGPLREDLVLAKHRRGWPDDRPEPTRDTRRLRGCAVAGRGMSPADAAVRVAAEMKGLLCGPKEFGSISHYAESVTEARKPNEAVVILYRTGLCIGMTHPHEANRILAATGVRSSTGTATTRPSPASTFRKGNTGCSSCWTANHRCTATRCGRSTTAAWTGISYR